MSPLSPLRRFFRRSRNEPRSKASAGNRSHRAPSVERLESRIVLDYDVSFAAGLFVVQASVGVANSIEVQWNGSDYEIEDVSSVSQVFNLQQSAIDEGWSTTNGGRVLVIPAASVAGRSVDINLGDEDDSVFVGDPIADAFHLNGQSDDDTFIFANDGSIGGNVSGGTGEDTIIGDNNGNAFTINAAGGGLLADKILGTFSSIENLTGGSGVDTFTFTNTGSLAGAIQGGSGSADRIFGDDDGNDFVIDAAGGGSITGKVALFTGIEGLTGGAGNDTFRFTNSGSLSSSLVGGDGDDTLIGDDDGNSFTILNVGSGSLGVKTGNWSQIENLTGGTGDDIFTFTNPGSIAGNLDGGDGNDSLTGDANGNVFVVDTVNGGTLADKIGGTFANVENLTGGAGIDTFTVTASGSLAGNVNGAGGNDTFTFENTGSIAGNANGGAGDDTFTFNAIDAVTGDVNGEAGNDTFLFSNVGSVAGNVNGGADTDTLVGDDNGNLFQITGSFAGVLDGKMTGFTNIENLTGGAGEDTFTFTNSGNLGTTGLIDGGGGNDTLIGDDGNVFVIDAAGGGEITGKMDAFSNIENLVGGINADTFAFENGGSITGNLDGGAGSNTIVGDDDGNAFVVAGVNTGTLADKIGGTFTNIQNLTGGSGEDIFTFAASGRLDGNVSGGAGTDTIEGPDDGNEFVINTSVGGGTFEDKLSTFTAIERLIGGAGDDIFTFTNAGLLTATNSLIDGAGGIDTIVGDDSSAFVIDAVNGGSITGKLTQFTNVENLTGGLNADTFAFTVDGSLDGAIDGAGGSDSIFGDDDGNSFLINAENAGVLQGKMTGFTNIETLSGGAGDDTFTFTNDGSITGALNAQGGADTLVGDDDGNVFTLIVANGGLLEGKIGGAFTNVENLIGGSSNDVFVFIGNGSVDGDIDGGGDSLDLDPAVRANNFGDLLDYSGLTAGVTVTFGRPNGTASRVGGLFRNVESVFGTPGNDVINKFFVGNAAWGFAKGSFIDGKGGIDRIDSLNNVGDLILIQDSVNNNQKPLIRANLPNSPVFGGVVDVIVPLRAPNGTVAFRLLTLTAPRPSTRAGVNQFFVLTRQGFMNAFNSYDVYRATVRMLFSEALGVDRALFATNAAFQNVEALWAFDRGYSNQVASFQLIRAFLRGAIAPGTGQDFFLNFFQRFDRNFTPSDSAVLALMARRNPQSLGQIVRGRTSFRSIYPNTLQAAASWIRQSIVEPALAAGVSVNPTEVNRLTRLVASTLGSGSMLTAIEQIFNSTLFIRTAVAIARTDADASTFNF